MLDRFNSSLLLSLKRAITTYGLAFSITLGDTLFFQFLGIYSIPQLLIQTIVHGTGFYLGFTLVALPTTCTENLK